MKKFYDTLFSKYNYIYTLVIWCLINSTVPFKCNKPIQYVAILFALWGGIIVAKGLATNYKTVVRFSNSNVLNLFFIVACLATGIGVYFFRTNGILQNGYAVVALLINFYIIYNNNLSSEEYNKILKVGLILSFFIIVLSNITLIGDCNIEFLSEEGKYFTIGITNGERRFTGLLGNPNDLARCALFGLLTLVLYWSNAQKTTKLMLAAAVIFFETIIICQSRGVEYGVIAASFIFVYKYSFRKSIFEKMIFDYKQFLKNIVIWLLIISAMFIVSNIYLKVVNEVNLGIRYIVDDIKQYVVVDDGDENESLKEILSDRHTENKGFSTGRGFLIKLGIEATKNYSILWGCTPGNTKAVSIKYMKEVWQLNNSPSAAIGNSHNTLIQAFLNYGIFSFLILFLFYIKIVRELACFIVSKDKMAFNIGQICLAFSVISILMLSMVENIFLYSFDNESINILFMLVLNKFIDRSVLT